MREIINELIAKAIADNNEPVRKAMIELRERLPKQPSRELTHRISEAQTRRIAELEEYIDSRQPLLEILYSRKSESDDNAMATLNRIIAERDAAQAACAVKQHGAIGLCCELRANEKVRSNWLQQDAEKLRTERDEFEAAYQALLSKHEPIVEALHRYHLALDLIGEDAKPEENKLIEAVESQFCVYRFGAATAKEEARAKV